MNHKFKRLSKNTLLVFLGKAGSSLLSLLMLPLYTRWLSPDQYGSVDLMNTYSSILMSIASFCIYDSIFVIPNNSTKEDKVSFYSSGYMFIVLSALVLSLLLLILNFLIDDSSFLIDNGWMILSLTISMVLVNYSQQFTRSIGKLGVFSITGIIQTLSIAICAFIFIPSYGVMGYILSLIYSNIIAFFYSVYASRSYKFISINNMSFLHLNKLLKYGIPLIPNSLMWWLVNGFNRPIMESQLGYEAIGLYAIAIKFPNIISSLSDVFMNAFGLTLVEEYGQSSFSDIFNKVLKSYMMVIVLLAILIVIFAPLIISLFTDSEYYSAWRLLPGLTFSAILSSMSGLVGGVFMARKESKYFLYSSVYGAIASLVFTYVLINSFGMTGCILAVCLSFGVMLMIRLYYAWKDINGFDIKYYIVLFGLLGLCILIRLSTVEIKIRVLCYIIVGIIYFLLNRNIFNYPNKNIKKQFRC